MNIAMLLLMMAGLPAQVDTVRFSLDDAIVRAGEANPALRAERARADVRSELPNQASTAFLPSLSFGLQGVRTTDPVMVFGLKLRQANFAAEDLSLDALNRPAPYAGFNATATMQVPILVPEGLYGFQAARHVSEAGQAGVRRAAGATRFQTVQVYTGALLAARQMVALEAALVAVRGHVTQAEALYDQGLVTRLDARMAGLKASEIEVNRVAATAQARNAFSMLKALLDVPESAELVLTDDLFTVSRPSACVADDATGVEAGEYDCSWEGRGDLQAYAEGMEAASSGVKRAWASQLPSIAAFGSVGQYSQNAPFSGGSGDWTVGIGLSWTPFNGLAGVGAVRAAKAEEEAANADMAAALRRAEVEVLQARRMLEAATQGAFVAGRAAEEARVALEQARARYASGTSPISELLDVQAASTNAVLSELTTRRDLALAHAALDLAYGVFDR
jgi:outer membrane protein